MFNLRYNRSIYKKSSKKLDKNIIEFDFHGTEKTQRTDLIGWLFMIAILSVFIITITYGFIMKEKQEIIKLEQNPINTERTIK